MKSSRLVLSVLGVAALAAACSVDQSSSTAPSTKPVASVTTAPGTSNANTGFLGTWSSSTAMTPTLTGCGNFTWAVSSQTATNIAGTFSFTCAGNNNVTAAATGVITSPTTADLTETGSGVVSGQTCDFSVSGTGTLSTTAIMFPYSGTTCFGPVTGTETLARKSSTPAPAPPAAAPAPAPAPTPPPPPPPPAFDLTNSTILNSPRDLASWPITTTITNVDISAAGVHVDFSKANGSGRWPDVTPPGWDGSLQYTLGMCLDVSGQWYCSAVVEFWYGLDRAGGPPSQYALNWFYDPNRWAPMTGHQPATGETIGFFVCAGDCRNNLNGDLSPVKERSNVVMVQMPTDAGAVYPQRAAIRRR